MLKNSLFVIIGVILLLGYCVTNKQSFSGYYLDKNLPKLYAIKIGQKVEPKYDSIVRLSDKNNKFFCSGFVVDDNYVITAAHCLQDKAGKSIKVNDKPSKVAGFFSRVDLGLVRGDFKEFKKIPVDTQDALSGYYKNRVLVTCGYPLGQKQLVCTPVFVIGQKQFFTVGHGELYPGMSGGPAIDPETGTAVGINCAADDIQDENLFDLIYLGRLTGFGGIFNIEKE